MADLTEKIKEKIKNSNGLITFKDFMNFALYYPELGYYTKGILRFGKTGDFITSPHTHRLFGALISRQLIEFWELLDNPKEFFIIEMGAGAGFLAKDILSYTKNYKKDFFNCIKYIIIEPFKNNIIIQKENLLEYKKNINWIKNITEITSITGCIISNELLDAFPVHWIRKKDDKFFEIYIGISNNKFVPIEGKPSNKELENYIKLLDNYIPNNYDTEINLNIKNWINNISKILIKGFILTIDYGYTWKEYFHPNRNRGTLLAYKGQSVTENILDIPGEQDITAHVNFSDLYRWGKEVDIDTIGYSSQWSFLASLDVEETFKEVIGDFNPFSPELAAIKMLLLPQGMGDSHKVMIQSKGIDKNIELKGFRLRNISDRLEIK